MATNTNAANAALATVDGRSFFARALEHGVRHGILTDAHLARIREDGPKGIVQIANHFGTAHLQASLETGLARMVNLISLYLEDKSNSNLPVAATSLRDNTLLSHSRGGSEMLKRLHAMPDNTQLLRSPPTAAAQKDFIDERTFASPLSLTDYRARAAALLENQKKIDFARWLARQLNTSEQDYGDHFAEEVINSAMLVCHVGAEPFEFPGKAEFVKQVAALRKPSFRPRTARFDALLASAPEDFRAMAREAMDDFIATHLPRLQTPGRSADEILFGDGLGTYFIRETLEADVAEFDALVARHWTRITRGKSDPASLATLFLLVATGQPPKASALLKDARAIVATFRAKGFDSGAVIAFIDEHAPYEQREDLKTLWLEDLKPEAEVHLADPEGDDTHMDRALIYMKSTVAATWKGR